MGYTVRLYIFFITSVLPDLLELWCYSKMRTPNLLQQKSQALANVFYDFHELCSSSSFSQFLAILGKHCSYNTDQEKIVGDTTHINLDPRFFVDCVTDWGE